MPRAQEPLARYREKRRFDRTSEPRGGTQAGAGGRYLIQKHEARRLHYDFRLELDGVLLSWAVTKGPSYDTADKRLAVRTEDHPLEYGTFEGTIPKGEYGGGTVMLWDTGSWTPEGDPHAGLKQGKLAFTLHGERLHGRWALVRMRPRGKEKGENWLLIKEKDEFADSDPRLLEEKTTSVVSGRAMDDIARGRGVWHAKPEKKSGKPPNFCAPALATLVDEVPGAKHWLYEIKYDGYRALLAADGANVRIFTRSGLDWTHRFPEIAKALAGRGLRGCLLDGEIVVIGKNGRTDFGALVQALEAGGAKMSCFLFDVLVLDGEDVRSRTLRERQDLLRRLLGAPDQKSALQLSEVFAGDGDALLRSACAHGLEGIIAKRAEAPYRGGRGRDWLKIKCGHEQEFVVIGFSGSEKKRAFASLLMAVREAGALRYAGRVGTGFSDAALKRLGAWRDAHARRTPACEVPAAARKNVVWVVPELVAQVAFAGWTPDRLIRQGRFLGLREDKTAEEVGRDMPEPVEVSVKLTHAERVIYPARGLTKRDVAAYVERAAPKMAPYMRDRFISLVRCPEGMNQDQKCFFQRHLMPGFGPDWKEQDFLSRSGKDEKFIYFEDPRALAAAVQMGVLEFHIWGAKRATVQKPDRIVFDLDPDPSMSFPAVREAALRLREVLQALGLESLPLLTGGKGIHVVVPVQPRREWPEVKDFSAALAARLVADAPDRFTATMTKAKRAGKIFIDHFRNELGATAIAPYSPRARADGTVAWPLSWAALCQVETPNAMTIERARAALEAGEDGWEGYGKIRQSLTAPMLRAVKEN